MRTPGRVATCTRADAAVRLHHAKSFVEVAELILGTDDDLALPQVAASLAVLAGIAASDAVCCARLGQRSRGQDHRIAIGLLESVPAASSTMTQDLRRLLDIKDGAHYSAVVTLAEAQSAVGRARRLYDAAASLVK